METMLVKRPMAWPPARPDNSIHELNADGIPAAPPVKTDSDQRR
jgi:hypothetical protein